MKRPKDFHIASKPPLVAAYAVRPLKPRSPTIDETFTIAPGAWAVSIWRTTSRVA